MKNDMKDTKLKSFCDACYATNLYSQMSNQTPEKNETNKKYSSASIIHMD